MTMSPTGGVNSNLITAPNAVVHITATAARRICALAEAEQDINLKLRVAVLGGGCSGFQYHFALDDAVNLDDQIFERDAARIVIDETSLGLLGGSEVDFVEDLSGSSFQIRNPNAQSTCGCGTSFAIA